MPVRKVRQSLQRSRRRWNRWLLVPRVRIFGAPLHVHPSILAGITLLAFISHRHPLHAVVAVASYLAIVLIHEAGHAAMIRHLGYRAERVRLSVLHGSVEYLAVTTEWEHVLISWAGVLAQLAVAGPVLIVASALNGFDLGVFGPIVAFLGYVNLLIALVNLAPSPGLDGYTVTRCGESFRCHGIGGSPATLRGAC